MDADQVLPIATPRPLPPRGREILDETLDRIRKARRDGRPVVLAFGAHTIKNGLAPVLIRLLEQGWLTHLATNGAGIIHDWEFAFQGKSSEDVRANVANGTFGLWEETGYYLNLALNIGAYEGKGYGEAVGAFIQQEGLTIPGPDDLEAAARRLLAESPGQAAAAADALDVVRSFRLAPGVLRVPHRAKSFSVQAAAVRLGIPCTGHPMIGHDIIYTHPMNHAALLGRAAQRDFLTFAESIRRIEGGVYLSVGSAVMSPMIFEKSFAMAQNRAHQEGQAIRSHYMLVVDLAESRWDWNQGEPPEDHPDYYLRFYKTFYRMGGTARYLCADNRDFLLHLCQGLRHADT